MINKPNQPSGPKPAPSDDNNGGGSGGGGGGGGPRGRRIEPDPQHIERRWLFGQQHSALDPFNDNTNNPFLLAKDLFSTHSDLI
ncbi:MAG: hypothetical protein CL862_13745 [Cyanobium sp. NAT70]|nr:hypothetical protein [Cyanobium sp. NAT70]